MSGFELNKLAGAILLAALIAAVVVNVVDILYQPRLVVKQRGYQVAVVEGAADATAAPVEEVKIDIEALMKAANATNGEQITKKCLACHSFEQGGPNKLGPNLWNVVGNDKIAHPEYNYSDAMKTKGGKWDEESLFHFLNKPSKFIPGTKMSFAGLSKPSDIADVIAFLKQHK